MSSIMLLDCTLRDGGFINDWNFGFTEIKTIVDHLDTAGVDMIEVGFIDECREYDENRSIFPDTKSISPIFKNMNKPKALVVAMIDYGTCSIEKISPQADSCLDGIRVIFKKKDQDGAIAFLRQIKDKGYKIFANPVSITSYSKDEAAILIRKINAISPYAVSIVDTYGLMHSQELLQYFDIFNQQLERDIILGYHAHNNFQMAYANSIILMNKDVERTIIIDGSLYGMGKSAGNTCTELLAMYMNNFCGKEFDVNQLQELIDVHILEEYRKKSWGYSLEYFISAFNNCHPSYVKHLLDKKTLSVKSVNKVLSKIDTDKKLSYDKPHIDEIYNTFQTKIYDDTLDISLIRKDFLGKTLLILGPGKTLDDNFSDVAQFVKKNNPLIISINFINELFPIDYIFMCNAKRYSHYLHDTFFENMKAKLICTSNIAETGHKIDYLVNYSKLLVNNEIISDNPLVIFLRLLINVGVLKVWVAGFDGYSQDNSKNYYREYSQLLYSQDNVLLRNDEIKKELHNLSSFIEITSLTPTRYL